MSATFDETTRRLLREAKVNGGLNDQSLFDLMVAGHDEAIETAATLATETKVMATALAATLVQERRDLKTAIEKVRTDLMVYNVKLGGTLEVHIEDDRAQLARIASHLESEAGTITRAIDAHCADVSAHGRAPRRKDDPPDANYLKLVPDFAGGSYEREQYDKLVRSRFMSSTTKYVVVAIVIVMLAALAYTLLVEQHDLTADLATGLSSTIAVTMLIWAMLRKDR